MALPLVRFKICLTEPPSVAETRMPTPGMGVSYVPGWPADDRVVKRPVTTIGKGVHVISVVGKGPLNGRLAIRPPTGRFCGTVIVLGKVAPCC